VVCTIDLAQLDETVSGRLAAEVLAEIQFGLELEQDIC